MYVCAVCALEQDNPSNTHTPSTYGCRWSRSTYVPWTRSSPHSSLRSPHFLAPQLQRQTHAHCAAHNVLTTQSTTCTMQIIHLHAQTHTHARPHVHTHTCTHTTYTHTHTHAIQNTYVHTHTTHTHNTHTHNTTHTHTHTIQDTYTQAV